MSDKLQNRLWALGSGLWAKAEVNEDKQVAIRGDGSSRSGPVRVSPAESNLVKPLKVKIRGGDYWWQAADGKAGNTICQVDIPFLFHLAKHPAQPNIMKHPFAPGARLCPARRGTSRSTHTG
jgi:hypothetical protein